MPSRFDKNKPGPLAIDPAGKDTPDVSPDVGMSAAFRHVLGNRPGEAHLPGLSLKTGQGIARQAKADKPAFQKGAPRKTHIGPRSGHK